MRSRECLNCSVRTYSRTCLCSDCIRASLVSAALSAVVVELVRLAFRWLA